MGLYAILFFMLRMRRIVAFSGRVHNYILLLALFSLTMFYTQLWWNVQPSFSAIVTTVAIFLTEVGLGYAICIVLLSIILWVIDKIFPWAEVIKTLVRALFFTLALISITLFNTVTQTGIVFHL